MTRRARTWLFGIAGCLVAAVVAAFLWLPWNPFEADAGPLDEWVPDGVDAVIRLDAGALREADPLRSLWNGPAGARLRAEPEVGEAIDALAAADRGLADVPTLGGGAATIEADLAGGEVLVAWKGDDGLVLTRISGRAKAVEILRRLGDERLAEMGLAAEGGGFVLRRRGSPQIRFARRRDVLLVSTSKDLLASALALADGRGRSIVARDDYRDARPPAPSGATIGVWARGPFVRRFLGDPPLGAAIANAAFRNPVSIEADARVPGAVRLTARISGSAGDVASVAARADRFADPDEAFAVGALPVSAAEAVAALLDSQPPARRKLLDDLLAEQGSSVRALVEGLARHLEDGVGFVVSRPRVLDSYRLDDADGDARFPIPVTTVVFRLRAGEAEALVADLSRNAESLVGEGAQFVEEAGPASARIFRARDGASFGPEWELLRPAFAIAGDVFVFSTNEADLRRALERTAARAPSAPLAAVLRLDASRWRDRLLDLRYEVATRETFHDWAAERREIRATLAKRARPEDVKRLEDAEIEKRIAHRKDVEFPEAQRRYRESLRWLDAFEGAEVRCVPDGKSIVLDATVRLR